MSDLGLLVKEELNLRDCGHRYDPNLETYTTWNGDKYDVYYVDEIDVPFVLLEYSGLLNYEGLCRYKEMELLVKKRDDIVDMSGTLQHEMAHADYQPFLNIAPLVPGMLTFLWCLYGGRGEPYEIQVAAIGSLLLLPVWFVLRKEFSEIYANLRERKFR